MGNTHIHLQSLTAQQSVIHRKHLHQRDLPSDLRQGTGPSPLLPPAHLVVLPPLQKPRQLLPPRNDGRHNLSRARAGAAQSETRPNAGEPVGRTAHLAQAGCTQHVEAVPLPAASGVPRQHPGLHQQRDLRVCIGVRASQFNSCSPGYEAVPPWHPERCCSRGGEMGSPPVAGAT